jgi:integrase
VKGPVWHVPGDRSLNGELLDVPLASEAVAWLQALRGLAGKSEWLLPTRREMARAKTPHAVGATINLALGRVDHGLEHFTVEDLRRTTRSQLTAPGVRREVVEKCLGHRYRSRDGVCDENDYW